jgi:peptidoglycan hydrolase-like protein with peptidoglycan-binding domain
MIYNVVTTKESNRTMFHHKRFLLLGSIVLLAVALFTFSPMHSSKAFAASLNGCPPTQSQGASNTWVAVLPATLNASSASGTFYFYGYPLSVDGQFGQKTENAVVAWQDYLGSFSNGSGDPNGVVGNGTWSSLGYCYDYHWGTSIHFNGSTQYSHCPPNLSYGSSGIWVQTLQDMLNTDITYGEFTNTPQSFTIYLANDGSFGSQTQAAVTDFQYAESISHDGSVGPQTWGKLRMCW